jgi:hypothetical protein
VSSDYHYFVDKPTSSVAPRFTVLRMSRFWTRQGDPDYDIDAVSTHASADEAEALAAELNAQELAADQERRAKIMARVFPAEPDAETLEHEIETQAFLSRHQI